MRATTFALVATVGLLTASCSAIVTISEDEIRCFGEGPTDPCPSGRVCRGGYCQLVDSVDSGQPDVPDGCSPDERGEICNGADDDCDGLTDEGHDQDMDEFTWCGGGIAVEADCDDNDANAHPGRGPTQAATERCDGADNDCDGLIDEDDGSGDLCDGSGLSCIDRVCADPTDCSLPSVTCPMGQSCDFDLNPPQCVAGGCMVGSCPDPQVCNTETGDCVTPAAIGDDCDTDDDCSGDALCVRGEALRISGGARVCTQSCCTDEQCPGGTICRASGSGVKLCIPPSDVMLTAGTGAGRSACSAGSACSSAVCLDDSTCLENCGNDADCASGSDTCTAVVTGGNLQFACGAPVGGGAQGDLWSSGCQSGLYQGVGCLEDFPLICDVVCVGACQTTADCPSIVEDLAGAHIEFYCGYSEIDPYPSVFAGCARKYHGGGGAEGASCTNNSGCRDNSCLMGRCADTCCSDAGCPSGQACRPIRIRGHWESHCV